MRVKLINIKIFFVLIGSALLISIVRFVIRHPNQYVVYAVECDQLPQGYSCATVPESESCPSGMTNLGTCTHNGSTYKYCCNSTTPTPNDECQYDSDCNAGCRCLADPNGNYCYCPTNTPTPTPTNHAPTCSIDFPTDGGSATIEYNALTYMDQNGSNIEQTAEERQGHITTHDSDGDTVTITGTSLDKNCLQLNRSGQDFSLRPLGFIDDVAPEVSGNVCAVHMVVNISDGKASASCSKDLTVTYPPPRLNLVNLYDKNNDSAVGFDSDEANSITTSQFTIIGSTAKDPHSAVIELNNPGTITQTLKPVDQRFSGRVYRLSDRAYFQVALDIVDANGNNNLDLNDFRFSLHKTAGGVFDLPLLVQGSGSFDVASHRFLTINTYGVRQNGTVQTFSNADWTQCLQGTFVACVRGAGYKKDNNTNRIVWDVYPKYNSNINLQGARYWLYVEDIKDLETIDLLKGGTSSVLHNTSLSLTDSNLNVKDRDNNDWTYHEFLYLDTTPPLIENVHVTEVDADTIRINVTVNDTNHIDSAYVPSLPSIPLSRTYVFAENERVGHVDGVSNRFLRDNNNHEIKGQDFGASHNTYGWTEVHSYSSTRKEYSLTVNGVLGGDNIIYGFCAYDKAGNATCINADDSGNVPINVGRNWLKTSLGHVYSMGGFSNLPDYGIIANTSEDPTAFANFVSPFNATDYASFSNFASVFYNNSSSHIYWGYNGHYNQPAFYIGGVSMSATNWADYLLDLIHKRCQTNNECVIYNDVSSSNTLQQILQNNIAYKVIYIAGNITLPDSVTYTGKNIIIVRNSDRLTLFNVYKQGGLSNITNNLLVISRDNAQVIIDDNPNAGYDSITDVVQAGFLALGNSSFKVVQGLSTGNRDAYKDSNNRYDRLVLQGLVYSQTLPVLERDLVMEDNETYPSEWFIYDPTILDNYLDILGRRKIQTFNCAIVNYPLCEL